MNAQMMQPVIRMPPHSTEAEQSVLGGLMLDARAWDRIAGVVTEADFYRDDHRRIFRHIAAMLDRGETVDVITVFERIQRCNEVDQTGGLAYLSEIANNTPSAANVVRYAKIVSDRAMRRSLLAAAFDTQADAEAAGDDSALDRIDKAVGRFMALAESRPSESEPEQIKPALAAAIDEIETLYNRDGDAVPGVATGFVDLDRMTTGLHPGQMIVVAARPAMGKTAFALNIAEHVAISSGGTVAIFSLEMTRDEIAKRHLSAVGRIDMNRIRTGKLQDDDWDKVTIALGRLAESGLIVDDASGLTMAQIRARARRVKRKQGRLDLVVIDYLQMIEANRDGENRNAELTAISRSIKAMAKELRCPVIALGQLSRKVEERTNKRPLMSDLRESGAIEQDADLVLLLYRDEYYKPDTQDKGIAEIIIGKQRSGPTGDIKLAFRGEFCRFDNLDFSDVARFASRPAQKSGSAKRFNDA